MKYINRIFIVSILFITVVSCKVGDSYERPELDTPDRFYEKDSLTERKGNDSLNMAEVKWHEFFKDSTLIDLIDTALQHNIDMKKAMQNIEISRQQLLQSKANFYPSLNARPAGYSREFYSENYNNYGSNRSRRNHGDNPPSSFYTERLAYTSSLESSWELDIWGKLRWQKEAARAAYMESEEFKKAVQTSLISEIASTYYNILMLNSQLNVARQNLVLNENTLNIIELQYDSGEVTSLAVKQTESQKLKSKALIPQLEQEYAIQENRLNRLLGRTPEPIEIEKNLEETTFNNEYHTGVPLELVANRPDVSASEYRLQVANARAGVAEAMKYPSLSINAAMGVNSFQLNKVLDPVSSGFALLNGAVFQPIFQNRKLKTNHKISLAERQLAELDFKNNLITAVNEVSDALVTIEKLEEEQKIAGERIVVTTSGLEDALFLFKSAFANYLEVITAQSDALESKLDLIRIQMQLTQANIELYRSLGGGWK